MPTIQRTVTTSAAPDTAMAYLADFSNAAEWDSGTVSCRRISGDGGVGTQYRNVSKFMGRTVELTYTVESLTDSRLVIVGRTGSSESKDTITVTPDGTGSKVDYLAEFTFTGLIKLVQPLMVPFLQRLGNQTAKTLRAALDRL